MKVRFIGGQTNRRVWGGVERIQGTGSWTSDVSTIKSELSPLNVGISSSYDQVNKIVSITVQVFFTDNVTDNLTLYTMLTEDGIVANQSGGSSNYVHNHVFRAAIPQPSPQQWGEPITGSTEYGSLYSVTLTYDNNTTNYDMNNCELVAFVRNTANEEIISGNGAKVGSCTDGVEDHNQICSSLSIFPNPIIDNATITINLTQPADISYQICDLSGKIVTKEDLGALQPGVNQRTIDTKALEKGLYFINISDGEIVKSIKIIK